MANENWKKAKGIFGDAIKFAPDEHVRFLNEVCANDANTRREVESLLASFDDAESFMESPAVGEVADVIRQAGNLENGKCFGHYEIIRQIGAGGMGEVYLAQDKNSTVASQLKFSTKNSPNTNRTCKDLFKKRKPRRR